MKTPKAEQIPNLPEEIIEEILSRLPVKSLLKFRCVSKSWCYLIGSKQFIKIHLENSAKNKNYANHRIILSSSLSNQSLMHYSLRSLLNGSPTQSFTFDNPIYTTEDSVRVVGCCNGLICILMDRKHFFLWNPSTRKYKKLPDMDDKLKYGCITTYGFGCDELNGDYKVFGILSVFLLTGKYHGTRKVYSLKTNSWKRIEDRGGSPFDGAGKLASGRLHWCKMFKSRWDIVSFDLMSEASGMVQQPDYPKPSYPEGHSCPSLEVLGGCLCVLCYYRGNRTDVWVLKQYGVKESWDKVVSVPYLCGTLEGPLSTPLCMGSNGEILFIYGSTFVIYYPKYNLFSYPYTLSFDPFSEVDVYIESLVSLVPDGVMC